MDMCSNMWRMGDSSMRGDVAVEGKELRLVCSFMADGKAGKA